MLPTVTPALVLWAGTVRRSSLTERVAAAAATGYAAISLTPPDYRAARAAGHTDDDIRKLITDAGLRVAALDPFTKWLPEWAPPSRLTPDVADLLGTDEAEFLRIGEAVGATSMTVLEPFGVRWPDDLLAAGLARIAERAAEAGMRVNLEFVPYLGVPDLATAWRAVQQSGMTSTGIVLDTWHYLRGSPNDALLAAIPGERIGAVQVSDAPRVPPADLRRESLHGRLPAGEGELPLDRVLATLSRTGGLNRLGPEIFSDLFDPRPAAFNARHARQGLEQWRTSVEPTIERRGGART